MSEMFNALALGIALGCLFSIVHDFIVDNVLYNLWNTPPKALLCKKCFATWGAAITLALFVVYGGMNPLFVLLAGVSGITANLLELNS